MSFTHPPTRLEGTPASPVPPPDQFVIGDLDRDGKLDVVSDNPLKLRA